LHYKSPVIMKRRSDGKESEKVFGGFDKGDAGIIYHAAAFS
jgi:hypothetical protein